MNRRRRPAPWPGVAMLPLLLAFAAYAVVLAVRVPVVVHGVYWNSDAAISPTIAAAQGSDGNGRPIFMAADTFINAIWFDRLTGWIPGHVQLWMATPLLLSAAAALLLAATVRRAGAEHWRVGAVLALAAPPVVLLTLVPQEFHVSTFLNCVLLAYVLAVATGGGLPARGRTALIAGAGVVTGIDLSSDPLLLVSGVLPFVGAALLARLLLPGPSSRRALRTAIEVVAVTGVAAVVTGAIAARQDITLLPVEGDDGHPASPARMLDNARLAVHGLLRIADGGLIGGAIPGWSPALVVAGALVAGALVLPAVLLLRELFSSGGLAPRDNAVGQSPPAPPPTRGLAPALRRRRVAGDPGAAVRFAHIAYWSLVVLFTVGAFCVTKIATDESTVRYLVPVFYAIASLVPFVLSAPGGRGLAARLLPSAVALALAGWVALSAAGVAGAGSDTYRDSASLMTPGAVSPDLPQLVDALTARGLHRGYADYWDSGSLTWNSDFRLLVRPVMMGRPCGHPGGVEICPYHWNTADGWYAPVPSERSFLLLHPGAMCLPGPPAAATGVPVERFTVGSTLVLVFADDIAGRFVRSTFALCPPGES